MRCLSNTKYHFFLRITVVISLTVVLCSLFLMYIFLDIAHPLEIDPVEA